MGEPFPDFREDFGDRRLQLGRMATSIELDVWPERVLDPVESRAKNKHR